MAEGRAIEPQAGLELAMLQPSQVVGGDPLARVQMLPCRLVLETPVVGFTVRTLMDLAPGAVLETAAQHNEDLMLLQDLELCNELRLQHALGLHV